MAGKERKLVQAVHDTSGELLTAGDVAEAYFARHKFIAALAALNEWIIEAKLTAEGYNRSRTPPPPPPSKPARPTRLERTR